MSSELLLQQCSVSTDEAQRRIAASCQENSHHVQELTRDMDNIKSQKSRLEAKLIRFRKELRDRKVGSVSVKEAAASSSPSADRNVQRNQVLLDEEESMTQQLISVTSDVSTTMVKCENALKELVHSFKSEIQQQLEGIVISYQEFLDSNNIKFNIWQRVIRKVRDDVENIDIEQDLIFYRERVQDRYLHHLTTLNNTDEDLGLPKLQAFCAIQNDIVDLERSNERESLMQEDLLRPASPSSPNSEQSGSIKVFGSIIGGIKAIGDRGMSGGTHIMEGVSRGRMTGKKEDTRRRSRSTGSGERATRTGGGDHNPKDEERERGLDAVNDAYQHRLKIGPNSRSLSEGVADSDDFTSSVVESKDGVPAGSGPKELADVVTDEVKNDTAIATDRTVSLLETVGTERTERIDSPPPPDSISVLEPDDEQDTAPPKVEMSKEPSPSPFKLPEPFKELPVRLNPELVKFGIADEHIIEHFSCALIPKRGLLTQGRMFITKNHIAFSGWPELRVLIPLEKVEHLKKTNTVYIIPNAITVHTISGDMYFFGSFIDRDPCFEILSSMVNIAKSLVQVMGPGPFSDVDSSTISGNEIDVGSETGVAVDEKEKRDTGGECDVYLIINLTCPS